MTRNGSAVQGEGEAQFSGADPSQPAQWLQTGAGLNTVTINSSQHCLTGNYPTNNYQN
jgi:hypothetical protein